MSIVCTRTIAAALGAVGLISTAAASLAQQSNDPKAPDAQRGDAARDGKKTVDEFAEAAKHLEGPAANPECVVNVRFPNVFRVGPRNSLVDTFWVQSTNSGSTFSAPVKVTTATSNWCTVVSGVGPNFGDYISGFATGNHVFACWSDGRNGVPDTFSAVILGAGKSHH